MGAPPEDASPQAWLYRRILPGGKLRLTGAPRPAAFALRTGRNEIALSAYWADLCTPEEVVGQAGIAGCGVVRLATAAVQALGFEVRSSPDLADPIIGPAHVSLIPATLDDSRQIPLEVRLALCALSEWFIDCER